MVSTHPNPEVTPRADTSFDDLIGGGEHGRRHREAERFGGLEIDDHRCENPIGD